MNMLNSLPYNKRGIAIANLIAGFGQRTYYRAQMCIRDRLYAAEAAVMIGKHQPVPGHHHSGTKASEADYRILQRRAFRIV